MKPKVLKKMAALENVKAEPLALEDIKEEVLEGKAEGKAENKTEEEAKETQEQEPIVTPRLE